MEVRHTELKKVSRIVLIVVSLQVSIVTDVTCPTASKREDWDSAVQTVLIFFIFSPSQSTKFSKLQNVFMFQNLSRPIPQPTLSGS